MKTALGSYIRVTMIRGLKLGMYQGETDGEHNLVILEPEYTEHITFKLGANSAKYSESP